MNVPSTTLNCVSLFFYSFLISHCSCWFPLTDLSLILLQLLFFCLLFFIQLFSIEMSHAGQDRAKIGPTALDCSSPVKLERILNQASSLDEPQRTPNPYRMILILPSFSPPPLFHSVSSERQMNGS